MNSNNNIFYLLDKFEKEWKNQWMNYSKNLSYSYAQNLCNLNFKIIY